MVNQFVEELHKIGNILFITSLIYRGSIFYFVDQPFDSREEADLRLIKHIRSPLKNLSNFAPIWT